MDWDRALWLELHDYHTPSSYDPPIHTFTTLVRELAEVAEAAEKHPAVWSSGKQSLVEELDAVRHLDSGISRVIEANECCGFIERRASALRSALKAESGFRLQNSLAAMSQMGNFETELVERCLDYLVERTPKDARSDREAVLRRVAASHAYRQVFPVDSARLELMHLQAPHNCSGFAPYLARLANPTTFDRVCFIVMADESAARAVFESTNSHFKLARSSYWRQRLPGVFDEGASAAQRILAPITLIESKPPEDGQNALALPAVLDAWAQLERLAQLYAYVSASSPISVFVHAFAVSGTDTFRIQRYRAPSSGRVARETASTITKEKFGRIQLLRDERQAERLWFALGHYVTAKANGDPQLQLASIWSALESLLREPADAGSSHAVLQFLPRMLAHHAAVRRLRYVGICLHSFTGRPAWQGRPFSPTDGRNLHPSKLLELFRWYQPDGADSRQLMASFGDEGDFTRWQLTREYRIFSNHQTLLSSMEDMERRRRWNLERIYRVRNQIVHRNIRHPMADLLVSHAIDYFETAFDRILHDLEEGRAATIRQSLVLRDLEWRRLTLALSDASDFVPLLLTESSES